MKRGGKKPGAGRPKGIATPKSDVKNKVIDKADERKFLSALLNKCVADGLKYAHEVLTNQEKVTITRFTRNGIQESFEGERYSPELKIKILEIVIGKSFADKKEISAGDSDDPNKPQVCGFIFTPVKKEEKKDE